MKNLNSKNTKKASTNSWTRRLFAGAAPLAALLILGVSASAQINSAVPFNGQYTNGFEKVSSVQSGYSPNPIFLGRGDYHSASTTITKNWAFGCTMNPHGGSQFVGDTSGLFWFDFDMGPTRFGGYFGSNQPNGPLHLDVSFIGTGGALLGTDSITIQNNCGWQWVGWEFVSMNVLRIEVVTTPGPGYLMMDDLNLDLPINSGCSVSYCIGDGTDGECPCSNYGDPGHGCASNVSPRGGRLTESISNGCSFVMGSMNGLVAKEVTPNELGLFIEGKSAQNLGQGTMFADGRLCVSAFSKLQFVVADSVGVAATTVDLPTAAMNTGSWVGDEAYYQFIYRTPGAVSACGGQWNLTNGVHWTWTM